MEVRIRVYLHLDLKNNIGRHSEKEAGLSLSHKGGRARSRIPWRKCVRSQHSRAGASFDVSPFFLINRCELCPSNILIHSATASASQLLGAFDLNTGLSIKVKKELIEVNFSSTTEGGVEGSSRENAMDVDTMFSTR